MWEAARAKDLGLIDDIGHLETVIADKFGEDVKFKKLERNIIALRSGKFVIRSGQSLIISEINSTGEQNIRSQICLLYTSDAADD